MERADANTSIFSMSAEINMKMTECCTVLSQGLSPDPDQVAFREPVTRQPLYRVRFAQSDVWPEYESGSKDSVDIEIHQHWLEPADLQDLTQQQVCKQFQMIAPFRLSSVAQTA